mmetsp:Transcript_6535/g.11252  ORF Transcript_6535/g.11252 Transcript_6535/m.11252 type:complete len:390 (+) Transcript_6535:123-1292(+)
MFGLSNAAVGCKVTEEQPDKEPFLGETKTDEANFSEWRIRTSVQMAVLSKGYRNSDFRNPYTGESVLPTDVYIKLFKEIESESSCTRMKIFALLFSLYIMVLLVPMVLFDPTWKYSGYGFAAVLLMSFFAAFGVANLVLTRVYAKLDGRIEQIIEERSKSFQEEYGIELGYKPKKEFFRTWNDDSYVYLRRPYQELPSDGLLEDAFWNQLQRFPPIYLHLQVPGDLHINEKIDRPPKMILALQETHKKLTQSPIVGCLALLVVIPSLLYFSFFGVLSERIGRKTAYTGLAVVIFMLWATFYCLDKWLVKRYHMVVDEMTRTLNSSPDGTHNGSGTGEIKDEDGNEPEYILELATSPLPFRTGASARRYQLVRRKGGAADLVEDEKLEIV